MRLSPKALERMLDKILTPKAVKTNFFPCRPRWRVCPGALSTGIALAHIFCFGTAWTVRAAPGTAKGGSRRKESAKIKIDSNEGV